MSTDVNAQGNLTRLDFKNMTEDELDERYSIVCQRIRDYEEEAQIIEEVLTKRTEDTA